MTSASPARGEWSSKFAFVLAAAGSAVGLGNIWKFPSEVAQNGGAAFLMVYLTCCFLVGFPVMVAELAMGRHTKKNPVGAFVAISGNKVFGIIGLWGILCGVMILSFYNVVAGWAFAHVFSEFFNHIGQSDLGATFAATSPGIKSAVFTIVFMLVTIRVVSGGIAHGIERAAKTLMPILLGILFVLIAYVMFQDGAGEGLRAYLKPDLSHLTSDVIFSALAQSFFSLSLGMGALITYGSYLSRKQNLPEVAAYVTLADVGIAFCAGLLIMPAMYVAQNNGIQILNDQGQLIDSAGLVFSVLPALFATMAPMIGLVVGVAFFLLLSMAALTSTISLLEVPTAYAIDELGLSRKKAASLFGGGIGILSLLVTFNLSLIDSFDLIFNQIGLPLGGMVICLFLAYVWKTGNALGEIEHGFSGVAGSLFGKLWPWFVRLVCPILILIVFVVTVRQSF